MTRERRNSQRLAPNRGKLTFVLVIAAVVGFALGVALATLVRETRPQVAFGSVAEWLGGVGAVIAAIAALYIASSGNSRDDRIREADARERAVERRWAVERELRKDAAMIVGSTQQVAGGTGSVRAANLSAVPILKVQCMSARAVYKPRAGIPPVEVEWIANGVDMNRIIPVLAPGKEVCWNGVWRTKEATPRQVIQFDGEPVVTLAWEDLDGLSWESGELGPIPRGRASAPWPRHWGETRPASGSESS